jgi:dephospho-CoA kinase
VKEVKSFMKVIGVVGLPASGKGEFSKIAADTGIPVIIMGDMIRAAVLKAGLDPTDDNFGATANRLRAENGMDAIAALCVPEIRRQTAQLVLVDGIRGDAEVRLFRKHFPAFVLISIDSSFEKRLERIRARGRSDDFLRPESLRARDEREMKWGLGSALAEADINIKNEGSLDEFSRAVNAVLASLGRDP